MRWPSMGAVIVTVLAVFDVGLVTVVVTHRDRPAAADFIAPASSSPSSTVTANPTTSVASVVTSTSSAAAPSVATQELQVFAISGTHAIRALSPWACPSSQSPRLELTTDGGATWLPIADPAADVLRVHLLTVSTGWTIARATNCTAQYYSASNIGHGWSGPATPTGIWYVDSPHGVVHTPNRGTVEPCSSGDTTPPLSPGADAEAYLACVGPNGASRVLHTVSGGKTWSTLAGTPPADVDGLAWYDTNGYLLSSGTPGCAGEAVWRWAAGVWTQQMCLHFSSSGAANGPQEGVAAVSFSSASDGMAVIATGSSLATWVTTNAGATWTQSG